MGPGQVGGVRPCGSSSAQAASIHFLFCWFVTFLLGLAGALETSEILGLGIGWKGALFWWLVCPQNHLPGTRLAPESQFVSFERGSHILSAGVA